VAEVQRGPKVTKCDLKARATSQVSALRLHGLRDPNAASVLNSDRAIKVNIAIMRTFVKLRRMVIDNEVLAHKLDALEQKYDCQFKIVFDAIRQLMTPAPMPPKPIGFRPTALKK